ncbi:hypothetical protein Q4555_07555 [Octadecabacter sp. 1_MG-2023]|uniref:hypothetical protein n=1 Tax=unclassified Octadecabacter TaxID=196158 RepID=UPI001C08F121|nr:hypothetical protein [Octadecabacter sp. 1_MG-2023]MBU2994192.1 hypothetical protein [Octadecabacter sp. B2R22]MDO6734519.1 hypothetical protein [Octadecabacter sp. 1_MG-2023]
MIRAAIALMFAAQTAAAGGLMDRTVSFGALAYDNVEAPIYVGERHPAIVTDAIEYGLGPEGLQNGWDIVPAIIDIRDQQIIVTYPDTVDGTFPEAEFNGYVLDFLTDCVLFNGAGQDLENSTVVLADDAIFVEGSKLYVDMAGINYEPQTFIVINVDVADCPLS